MDIQAVQRMQAQFDGLAHDIPGEEVEFWFARELQEPLGYTKWENFHVVIKKAMTSCETTVVSNSFCKCVRLG